ncbi:MAG: serine/threonine protein kinase [Cyanobacteria bacterium HKST-UBA02]|nr:serine/threonine protein kinase [Cyanobacteria bacterium HKST-UBA02]
MNCPRCNRPKSSPEAGSITQWVSVCTCDVEISPEIEVEICKTCGKRIGSGRKGSFTQMIFRSDLCACQRPEAGGGEVEQTSSQKKGPAFEGYIDSGDDEEELDLDSDSFPVDRFKPVKELGRGAGGAVYLCRDRLLGKKVAVKILHVLTAEQLISFQEEAKATSRLEHPNIVQIVDFGSTDSGVPFMVLEYFPGRSLLQYLEEFGYMGESDAIEVVSQIMRGLDYAHQKGIFHRDLKPGNILVKGIGEESPEIKIIDFGLARVSELTGRLTEFQGRTLAGTPFYMSPDVINGHRYTAASEVYSLGCMLFEMITGSVPFSGDNALDTLNLHATLEAPRIKETFDLPVSDHIDSFLSRCLQKEPGERFPSMKAAIADLCEGAESEQKAAPAPAGSKAGRWKPALLLVLVILVLSGASILLLSSSKNETDRKSADSSDDDPVYMTFGEVKKAGRDFGIGELLSDSNVGEGEAYGSGVHLTLTDLSLKEYLATGNQEKTAIDAFHRFELLDCDIDSLEFFKLLGRAPHINALTIECSKDREGLKAAHIDALLETLSANKQTDIDYLSLSGSPIDRAVWSRIPKFDRLQALVIQTGEFDDRALPYILDTHIRELMLAGTSVTEKGLLKLGALKTIRRLSIASSAKIRTETIRALEKELPYLQEMRVSTIK